MQSLRDESHLVLLYRIALEAIINARKHSKGMSIGVKIRSPKPGVVEISYTMTGSETVGRSRRMSALP